MKIYSASPVTQTGSGSAVVNCVTHDAVELAVTASGGATFTATVSYSVDGTNYIDDPNYTGKTAAFFLLINPAPAYVKVTLSVTNGTVTATAQPVDYVR